MGLRRCLLALAASVAAAKHKIILVADVGIDDAATILLLARHPDIELLGVAASFGCHGSPVQTAKNAKRMLKAVGAPCVPVHVGSRYSVGDWELHEDSGVYIHGSDGLGDVAESAGEKALRGCKTTIDESLSAAEFIATSARTHPGAIIVATSPLTNLALAVLLEPRLPELVGSVLLMGGAVYHPGNVSPLAEANFAHDARAAKLVVDAFSTPDGDLLTIAPLDVTMRAMVSNADMQNLGTGVAETLLAQAWAAYSNNYCRVLKFCGDHGALHDVHPVTYLLWPELYNKSEVAPVDILLAPGNGAANGHSLVDRRKLAKAATTIVDDRTGEATSVRPPAATVLLDVDGGEFWRRFAKAVQA